MINRLKKQFPHFPLGQSFEPPMIQRWPDSVVFEGSETGPLTYCGPAGASDFCCLKTLVINQSKEMSIGFRDVLVV